MRTGRTDTFSVTHNANANILNEDSDLLTTYERDLLNHYIMGISAICICCVGILGNILSLIVLMKRSIGSRTTSSYLVSLALADTLALLATILTAVKDSRKPGKNESMMLLWQDLTIIPRAYPYFHSTAILFQVTSIWLTVAFTSDRYFMICHPFVAKRWCTVRLAKCVNLFIYICGIGYGIPRYFEYEHFEIMLPTNLDDDKSTHISNGSGFRRIIWYDLSDFGRSYRFMRIYHVWSWNILVVGIPFFMIAVMNSFLIYEIRRSSRTNAKQLNQQNQTLHRRHDTDLMLIGIIVIFFICQTPAAISHFSWGLISLKETSKLPWYLLNEIGNLLIIVNSAINFIPYYMFSRRFRRHFIQLFCPYRLVRDDGIHCVYVPRWVVEQLANEDSLANRSNVDRIYLQKRRMEVRNASLGIPNYGRKSNELMNGMSSRDSITSTSRFLNRQRHTPTSLGLPIRPRVNSRNMSLTCAQGTSMTIHPKNTPEY